MTSMTNKQDSTLQFGLLLVGTMDSMGRTEKDGRVTYYANLTLGGWLRESVRLSDAQFKEWGAHKLVEGDVVGFWVRPSVFNGQMRYAAVDYQPPLPLQHAAGAAA